MDGRVITLVPHTHWDREWHRSFEEFLERLVPMMDTLLRLADDGFPHFHLDGQTAMIDDYLAVHPDREGAVRAAARAGLLSVGPWFTQMDEFLVSGESTIRNLERGMARARELGGECDVGYLPDQFGHIGQMPQILAQAGIPVAVVTRGVPSAIDRTAFHWESPDGSRVLTEYLLFGYGLGGDVRKIDDPQVLASTLQTYVTRLRPHANGDPLLVMLGGDHHGPDPTLPARLAAACEYAPEVHAAIGSLGRHFAARNGDHDLPLWRGELRSSARANLLPGVVSARIHQKRERARIEALLERYAEPLAALAPDVEWPEKTFDRIWQLMLWNGAHDSVCGCSIDTVATAVDERHAEARALTERIVADAASALAAAVTEPGLLRFNPSPFERDGVPALGWRVDPEPLASRNIPVEVEVRGRSIVVDGVEISLSDEPDVGDLYNFCPGDYVAEPRIETWNDEIVARFDGSDVFLRFTRREGDPFVRIEPRIVNRRPDHRLRMHIALSKTAERTVAGSPFELVERDLVGEGGKGMGGDGGGEVPTPTWPARGFVLAGGRAVLAEGVVEYEIVDRRAIAITLLRCVGTISKPTLATRQGGAGPDISTPAAQMIGEVVLPLAVMPTATAEELLPAWERFALPLLEVRAPGGGELPSSGTLLEVDGVELSSVRRVGAAIEARVWNPTTAPADARVAGKERRIGPARIETIQIEGRRA